MPRCPGCRERLERIRTRSRPSTSPSSSALELIDERRTAAAIPGRPAAAARAGLLGAATQLEALDIVLRDPRRGLVDFPSIRDGARSICAGSSTRSASTWWHDPDAGFAGRQPL